MSYTHKNVFAVFIMCWFSIYCKPLYSLALKKSLNINSIAMFFFYCLNFTTEQIIFPFSFLHKCYLYVHRMEEVGIKPEHKVICFGQLFGMCDQVSFLLGKHKRNHFRNLAIAVTVIELQLQGI